MHGRGGDRLETRAFAVERYLHRLGSIHSLQRAVEVGSVNSIIAADLPPYPVEAIERGLVAENRDVITAA